MKPTRQKGAAPGERRAGVNVAQREAQREARRAQGGPSKLICIVAGQRAGTTALQRELVRSGVVASFGEVFQLKDTKYSFPEFARAHDIKLVDAMTPEGVREVARSYLEFLTSNAAPKHALIDMKFNSSLALAPAWKYPHEEPFFLRYLKSQHASLIFVWRRNLAEQVLSMYISQQLGIWHNLDAEAVGGRTLEAPIPRLKKIASLMCRSEADMHKHIAVYPHKIVIAYEDLFDGGELTQTFITAFGALTKLTLSPSDGSTGIRKNTVDKRDIITNYDEAVLAIDEVASRLRQAGPEPARPPRIQEELDGAA